MLTIFLHFCVKGNCQQIEHRDTQFNFGGPSGGALGKTSEDFIAREKIEVQSNFQIELFSNTYKVNLAIDKTIQTAKIFQTEATTSNPFPESESVDLSLNKNLPVGSIAGSPGVSASGSAGYSFSVFAPPGTNGMSPQIAVAYTSNMGDGALGRGWNIGGLSVISRTPKTIYHDGKTQGILLQDLVDSWVLDGNLLVASPANGINTFRPEKENFSLVTFVDNNDNDKSNDYYKVQTEGGTTMFYGSQPAANSKLILKDKLANDQVLSWYVDRIEDSYGNYMTYSYYNDGGEIHIKEIKYTGNDIAGIDPYSSIKFYYDLRTTNTSSFFLGNEIVHKLLLREIEVFCEEKSMSRYHFNYVNSTMPYLREIVKYGVDNTHLNSTLFSYGAGSPLSETVRELVPPINGQASDDPIYSEGLMNFKNYVSGDFNGDGRSDQVSISVNNSGSIPAAHLDWKLWLNYEGVMKESFSSNSNFPALGTLQDFHSLPDSSRFPIAQAIDVNGDGLDDLVLSSTLSTSFLNLPGTINIIVCYSNGFGFEMSSPITILENEQNVFADIDGNGRPELVVYHGPPYYNSFPLFRVWDFENATWAQNYDYNQNYISYHSFSNGIIPDPNVNYTFLSATDFDGDGAMEIMARRASAGTCFIKLTVGTATNSNGSQRLTSEEFYNIPACLSCENTISGDFNGDGITDYSIIEYNFLIRNLLLGTGNGFNTIQHSIASTNIVVAGPTCSFFAFDVNDDGKDDLVKLKNNGTTCAISAFYSGKGTEHLLGGILIREGNSALNVHDSVYYANNPDELPKMTLGDIDGDGRKDIFITQLDINGCFTSSIHFNKNTEAGLLKSSRDGFGNMNHFTYKTLSNGGSTVYTKGSGAIFPLIDVQIPQYVVTKLESSNGIGGFNFTNYSYAGLKLHKQGLGNLGFDKMETFSSVTNTRQSLTHNAPTAATFFERSPSESNTYLISNTGNLIPLTHRTYSSDFIPLMSGARHLTLLTGETALDNITGAVMSTTYKYDSNNNGILIEKHENINNGLQLIDSYYTPYVTTTGSWFPNKIETTTIITQRDIQPSITRTSKTFYDSHGTLTQSINDPTTNNEVVTNLTPDPQTGILLSTSVLSAGLPTQTASFIYDSKSRFVVESVNFLGQSSYTKLDPRWGKSIWSKGVDGLVSEIFYDGYGRELKSISPDHSVTTATMKFVSPNEVDPLHPFDVASRALFYVESKSTGAPSSKVFFDSFGRQIFSQEEGFGKTIFSAQKYDSHGRICDATSPYDIDMLTNSSVSKIVFNHTTFDNFNRVQKTTADDGVVVDPLETTFEYSYPGNGISKTKVTGPDGKTKTQLQDASGALIETLDHEQTKLSYEYYSDGNLKSTHLAGTGLVKSYEYTWGRLTKATDLNSGTVETTYNAYGQPTTVKDAKNQNWSFSYDPITGKLLFKNSPEGIYNYQYVSSGNGINQPLSITAPNGNKVSYEYDALNRPVKKVEEVYNQFYTSLLEYNAENRLQKLTYPGGFAVEYEYDTKGYTTKIKRADNGAAIWSLGDISASGQFTKFTLGTNAQSENLYSNFGFLQENKTTGIQNMNYTFDMRNGNMLQREDVLHNLTEDFTYDNLDRLKTISLNNTLVSELTYTANGNIESKTELGLYNYGAKPNAVIGVEDPNHLISQELQNITYTSFDKIATLEEANYKLNLSYGPNDERKRSQLRDAVSNALLCERIYLDGYEKTTEGTNAYEITYISAPTGLAAMYVKQNGASQGNMHYLYTDNLASITTLVDDNGNKLNQSFDAWGNARNPADWTTSNIPNLPNWLYRGYTGHEHLKEFALINMNGRMYDPVLARFLSPDKLLQNPSNTQNYNGYSYVLNNPLKYTDPSGWAYGGYRFLSYSNTSFNGWTTQDGFDDVGFNYNAHTGHAIDGIPCSNIEFAAAVRAGGTVHIPGLETFIVVTQADGTVTKFEDTGEAIDFYNEISSDFKLSVDFDGGLRLDNIKEKPNSIPAIAAPSLESLSAGGEGAPGGLENQNIDPQDEVRKKDSTAYDMKDMIRGLEDYSIPVPNKRDYLKSLKLPYLNPEKGTWTDEDTTDYPVKILLPSIRINNFKF
ncbi:MAG: hypothetical protein KA450_02305 [Bacteroidia bacterium]|nr:hypothetical protein [Bacteroidota bacterium]MBP6412252.1 hypothetical protein [Bacteroidia bacterium]